MQRPLLDDINLDDVAEAVLNLEPMADRRLHRDRITSIGGPDVLLASVRLQVININFVCAFERDVPFDRSFSRYASVCLKPRDCINLSIS